MATFSEKVKAREKNKVGSQHDRRKAQSSKIRDKNAARQGKVEKARGAKQLPKGSDRTARTVPSKTAKEKLAQTKAKKAAQKTASGPSPSSKKRAGASKTDYKPSSGKMASNTKTNYSLRSGLAKPGANAKDGISASTEGGGKASKVKSPVKKPKMQKFNATTAGTGTKAAPSAPNSGPQISKGKRLVRGAIRGGKSLARKTVAGAIALEAAGAISNMDKHGRENLGIKVPYPTATGSSRSRTKAAPKGDLNKVDLGMKGAVNAAQKKVNTFDATKAGTGVKRKGGGQTSAPATKTAAKAGGTKKRGGYSYTGPKVGSDEYKAMRAKKQAGYKAKARKNIAAKRAKSATTARQQGTTAPNYQQPVMQRRVGNEHRQSTYTGDSATTNDNLAKAANSGAEAGGEEKNFWGRTFGTPKEHLGGRTRMQWLVDQAGS